MGSDRRTERADRELVRVSAPECFAVFGIFLQHLIAESGVTEAEGSGKIDSVCLFYFLHEKIIPVFGATRLAEHDDLTFRYGNDRLDRHGAAEKCGGGGDAAALFQIFQRIQDTESVDLLLGGF